MDSRKADRFWKVLTSLAFFVGVSVLAQEGPPVPPRVGFPIDSYKFIDTNWTSTLGYAPRSFFGIEGVAGWSTNLAMRIAGTGPAWLQYNYIETDTNTTRTNIAFPEGGLSFWVRATWSSTNIEGGTGPGVPARLLEMGSYSEEGNWGWFSLFLDEAGSVLSLGVQSNQFTAVPIQAPISWASNEWHTVALNYTLTNMELFLDGSLAASATNGLPYWPSYGVLQTNGFFIGSDSSGSNIANADFEYLRVYNYAMPGSWISTQYNRVLSNYLQGGFGMYGFEGGGLDEPYGMEGATNALALGISFEGTNLALTVTGGTDGISYDLFYTTNLIGTNASQSSWKWLTNVSNGQTYYLYSQPSPIFYILGTSQDSDGDGLSDAYELLASKTDPNNPDTGNTGVSDGYKDPDGDGWCNLDEYNNGTNPTVFSSPPKPVSGLQSQLSTTGGTTNVILTWQSPSANVISYTIQRMVGTNVNTYTVTAPTNSWTDSNAPSGSTYQLIANYTYGSAIISLATDPTYDSSLTIASAIVRGPTPSDTNLTPLRIILGGNISANIAALRVNTTIFPLWYDYKKGDYDWHLIWNAGSQGWSTNDPVLIDAGYFDVPLTAFSNGVYQIPVTQLPEWCAYYFQLQPIGNDGRGGVMSDQIFARNVPFVDGSAVLKDNLAFLLRAGQNGTANDLCIYNFKANPNYAAVSPIINHLLFHGSDVVAELSPFIDSWLLRNWAYDNDFDVYWDGYGWYYFFWWNKNIGNYYGWDAHDVMYRFDSSNYITTHNAGWLNSQLTNNPPIYLQLGIPYGISQYKLLTNAGLTWNGTTHLASGQVNYFGLAYQNVRITDSRNPIGVQYDLSPGGSYADPHYYDWAEYFQNVAAPSLTTTGYYFTKPTSLDPLYPNGQTPLPNEPNFSVTNTTPMIITGVGQPTVIYGWAKQSTAAAGKYAYLGQYFDKAYKTDTNGNATSTETGILSEYGDFFATEPGLTILTTKPDPDENNLQGECPVHVFGLCLDANHDGTIDPSYTGPDRTSAGKPFRFWVNNDWDDQDGTEKKTAFRNCNDSVINGTRDLEDFTRIWICGMPALPSSDGYQVTLSLNAVSGNPAINLFLSCETNGGIGYLTDTNVANAQTIPNGSGLLFGQVRTNSTFTFPANFFTGGNKYFLFEGASIGSGELVLSLYQGTNIIANNSTWLDLRDVKDFYERVVITNTVSGMRSNWTSGIYRVEYAATSALGEDTNIIVLVHGINVRPWDCLQQGNTVFKRLYWSGYQGKFATVNWPCNLLTPIPDPLNFGVFNLSELKAYKAGRALTNYLGQLRARFPGHAMHLLAHSQGNAVVSEAIWQGMPFDTYILTQGAMPASAYDVNAPTNADLAGCEWGDYITPEWQPMGYHGVYTNLTGRIVNFFNPLDKVLGYWVDNQQIVKPSPNYWFDGTNSTYHTLLTDYTVTDPQESRAMVSRSRTLSIGQSGPETGHGIIQSAVNLNTQFGFNGETTDEHSAQWTRPIQTSRPYYQQVLIQIQPAQ